MILTWKKQNGFADTHLTLHSDNYTQRDWTATVKQDAVEPSPYRTLSESSHWNIAYDLATTTEEFELFDTLRADGLRGYFCFKVALPTTHAPAVVSISSRSPFPVDIEERIEPLRDVIGLTLYSAYRTSQAFEVSTAYIGPRTGMRVLNGAIARGSFETIPAGVMFCDVRGFTALSEKLGHSILPVMNRIFDEIGSVVVEYEGEILKFIGDAMLVIFSMEYRTHREVAECMVKVAQGAVERIALLATQLKLPVAVGFGCHVGEVVYGNIGTQNRLDFTVLGSAVNLASRLESLCKPLEATAVFSQAVQEHVPHLAPGGAHVLKGIADPVDVWTL